MEAITTNSATICITYCWNPVFVSFIWLMPRQQKRDEPSGLWLTAPGHPEQLWNLQYFNTQNLIGQVPEHPDLG